MNNEKSELLIPIGRYLQLKGDLNTPKHAGSLVIFSHGSGSSRFSPRNRYVADMLNKKNIATLLTDLLTEDEDSIYENRFDIDMLTKRLSTVTDFMLQQPHLKSYSLGYFGASTGAASALQAAAKQGLNIGAVVSRGGRPDLAKNALPQVKAPTLLIVGGLDEEVIELNKKAYALLRCEKRMEIVNSATHLFEEAGKLEEVAALAGNWFKKYLNKKTNILTRQKQES